MAGSLMLTAPMIKAGVVLSQPPIRTAPSTGCERSNSSVSIARKLRYIMLVGLVICSPTLMAGSSTGKPPACQMPRFTSSARCRMWLWQVFVSDQVLTMPITGLPAKSSRAKPISMVRERWPKARILSTPNQRCERRSSGFLRAVMGRFLNSFLRAVLGQSRLRVLHDGSAGAVRQLVVTLQRHVIAAPPQTFSTWPVT